MSAHTEAPPYSGVFRDAEECDEVEVEVRGKIPPGLRGTLYRNGPARWDAGGFSAGHIADGDGLLTKFVIDDGKVRFQSRYVRTPKFRAQEAAKGDRIRTGFTQSKGGPLFNFWKFPADSANTHAITHADRLLALSDIGKPWEIAHDDLSTVGTCDFDGALPRLSLFSPHPKIDPITGELLNFGMVPLLRPGPKLPIGLRCYRVDRTGAMSTVSTVPLDDLVILHDFAITEHYLVLALAPIAVDFAEAAVFAAGFRNLGGAADYRPELGMKVVLVPRAGGKHRVVECDPLLYVHVNNAYEDGEDVVLDVVQHQSLYFLKEGAMTFRTGELSEMGRPVRLRITKSGRVLRDGIDLPNVEFPVHDERRTGSRNRYSYFTRFDSGRNESTIVKVDHQTGAQQFHTFTGGQFAGEVSFVPRTPDGPEDDGWLLGVTYTAHEHRNALFVLDAHQIERPPLATAKLHTHFYPGFHGSFTPRVARRGTRG